MAPIEKRLLVPSRRRSIPAAGFAWIDRRVVQDGFLGGLTAAESLLYFFLVTVGDRDGLSFWGERKLASTLKLTASTLEQARRGLERKDLVVYRAPIYQVLSLPESPSDHHLADQTLVAEEPPHPSAPSAPVPLPRSIRDVIERAMNRDHRGDNPR